MGQNWQVHRQKGQYKRNSGQDSCIIGQEKGLEGQNGQMMKMYLTRLVGVACDDGIAEVVECGATAGTFENAKKAHHPPSKKSKWSL